MDLGDFGTNTLKPMLWGFNFLLGTLFGVVLRSVMNRFKRAKIVNREYINNYLLNRISGFFFDIMIVAGTASINFKNFGEFVLPFTLVCALGTVVTFFYVKAATRHLYPSYPYEGFFSMFGMRKNRAKCFRKREKA